MATSAVTWRNLQKLPVNVARLRSHTQTALESVRLGAWSMDVMLVDNKRMKALNFARRRIPQPTDILSMPPMPVVRSPPRHARTRCPCMHRRADRARVAPRARAVLTACVLCAAQKVAGKPRGLGGIWFLGDIVVSVEYAAADAGTASATLDDHLTRLLVHGVCHLMGYDHEKPEDYQVRRQWLL